MLNTAHFFGDDTVLCVRAFALVGTELLCHDLGGLAITAGVAAFDPHFRSA